MRVYEFAKKFGATSAEVLKAADAHEIEAYSPLSQLEAADVSALTAEFAKRDAKTAAASIAAKRKAKAVKAASLRAAKDKVQSLELEEHRAHAAAAAKVAFKPVVVKPAAEASAVKPVAKPSAAKPVVAQPAAVEAVAPAAPRPVAKPMVVKPVEQKPVEPKPVAKPVEQPAVVAVVAPAAAAKSVAAVTAVKTAKKKGPKPFRPVEVEEDDDPRAAQFLHGELTSKYPPVHGFRAKNTTEGGTARPGHPPAAPARGVRPAIRVPARAGFTPVAAAAAPTITMSVQSREIAIRGAIVVKELASKLNVRPNRLIADLMQLKVLASINQRVEPEIATKVAAKYGFKVAVEHARNLDGRKPVIKAIDADDEIPKDAPESLRPRPPVVTFLGHVDHGKTTLMDYIRHTKVAAGEAGGITQQISAYQVDVNGRKITFLDTPGHAAFSAMRQRGAALTDIAVIIIAADDGIMPQTEEAIKVARQAGVQIMVALTKCDLPTAKPERVKQMLQKEGLTPEEWGGDVVCCEVSGITGKGVDQLLEMILLQADVLELTANPDRRANGYVVEAELEQGFGPSAVLLVTGGTLHVGDSVLVGEHFGKVRSLIDDKGRRIKEAGPSTPVKCTGLSGVPDAGSEFRVMLDEKRARDLAEKAAEARKLSELSSAKAASLDDLMSQMKDEQKRELNLIVKSDTQGSLEAIVEALHGIKSTKVSLRVIGEGAGNVTLTDVKAAAAGKAIIVGFDIGNDSGVQQQARHDGVHINTFRIIYELMDFVKKSMLDLLPPEYKEVVKGHATVKAIYDIGKLGRIAGAQMLDGTLLSTGRYRLLRGGAKVWEGKLQSLKHFKDEVKEVTGQQECGVHFANFEKFAEGDTIECYILEELPRSL